MINFFRKIRKKLADDNKPLKYMRYAIGEIVLVVIGILIALQINTWNNERINRIEEKAYLKRLAMDLNRDLNNIQLSIVNYEKKLVLGLDVLDSLGNQNIEYFKNREIVQYSLNHYSSDRSWLPRTMGEKLYAILRINLYYQSDITFQELLSTGKIDIIKNQKLKAAIQEHYLKMTAEQNFQDRIVMTIQTNYRTALNENSISTLNMETLEDLKGRFTSVSGLVLALENYLNISEAILGSFMYGENSIKKSTENLISLITAELGQNESDN